LAILGLELLQIRDDVHAVDAAVGPEIEQNDLATQFAQTEPPVGIEPFEATGKVRRIHFTFQKWILFGLHVVPFR
jgi:hypothetical protein